MGCCGQGPRATRTEGRGVLLAASGERGTVKIQYLGKTPVRLRGPATGARYSFPVDHRIQVVDAEDAELLVRGHLFRRA